MEVLVLWRGGIFGEQVPKESEAGGEVPKMWKMGHDVSKCWSKSKSVERRLFWQRSTKTKGR